MRRGTAGSSHGGVAGPGRAAAASARCGAIAVVVDRPNGGPAGGRGPTADAPRGERAGPRSLGIDGVSCETVDRLAAYADLLRRWQRRINLVSRDSLDGLWDRHIRDSAQLLPLIPPAARTLVDLGSGAGFPGLILAILGVPEVHLIDSDHRKAAFLREAARIADVRVTLHVRRIETVQAFGADIVTARALAPLVRLIPLVRPFVRPDSVILLPKGQDVDRELTEATKSGIIDPTKPPERLASRTDPAAVILRFGGHSLVRSDLDADC